MCVHRYIQMDMYMCAYKQHSVVAIICDDKIQVMYIASTRVYIVLAWVTVG